MAKATTDRSPRPTEPAYEQLPTWSELLERLRADPEHKPYTGPSSAHVIREDRDSR